MRFRLRTLLIVLAIGPPVVAIGWWYWPLLPLAPFPVAFVWATLSRMWAGLATSADGDEGFLAVIYTLAIATASVMAALTIAFMVYAAFRDFAALYGGMAERTPRVIMDFFTALAVGSIPGALVFWLTWPRKRTST